MRPATSGGEPSPACAAMIAGIAQVAPGYDGYAVRPQRREAERRFRLALAGRLRVAREAIGRVQAGWVGAGWLEPVVGLEQITLRLGRHIDRLAGPTTGTGRWFGGEGWDEATRMAVVAADRTLVAGVEELVATATALRAPVAAEAPTAEATGVVAQILDELNASLDARAALLAAPQPPRWNADAGLAMVHVGDRLVVEGQPYRVIAEMHWLRGDRCWSLGERAEELTLWQDTSGELVLFEDQPSAIALPPPDELDHGGEHFRLLWHDDGAARRSDRSGRSARRCTRWLFAGDAGGRLWLEAQGTGVRAWRGTLVKSEDVGVSV